MAEVRKWYRVDTFLTRSMYPGKEVGRTYPCELWKSAKGNWLLTHEEDYWSSSGGNADFGRPGRFGFCSCQNGNRLAF